MRSTQKAPGAPASRQVPGQFPNRLEVEVIRKNVSGWLYK
jgi:hypothetical protein